MNVDSEKFRGERIEPSTRAAHLGLDACVHARIKLAGESKSIEVPHCCLG
jgi:hypothetical protein